MRLDLGLPGISIRGIQVSVDPEVQTRYRL